MCPLASCEISYTSISALHDSPDLVKAWKRMCCDSFIPIPFSQLPPKKRIGVGALCSSLLVLAQDSRYLDLLRVDTLEFSGCRAKSGDRRIVDRACLIGNAEFGHGDRKAVRQGGGNTCAWWF